ncbi:hypothetical protein [Streptomyces sp. NPDC003077]|uniref:hypothetical protein n=1 Tax=Streptomyces sp. NPDC003077 TaxID=3154443 RepID=UPI0033ADC163
MNDARQIRDEDLMDVAHDPEQARRLRKALLTLADSPKAGAALQEMAQEVLSGRLGMKDALRSPAYMDALDERVRQIKRAAEDQSPDERKASREQFARWQREQDQAAEEQERPARNSAPKAPFTPSPHHLRGGNSPRR